jgi:hypothetical protein
LNGKRQKQQLLLLWQKGKQSGQSRQGLDRTQSQQRRQLLFLQRRWIQQGEQLREQAEQKGAEQGYLLRRVRQQLLVLVLLLVQGLLLSPQLLHPQVLLLLLV